MSDSSCSEASIESRADLRRAQVSAPSAPEAVHRFHAAVAQDDPALVIFFCSSDYDPPTVAREMARHFGDAPVVGCTTAGEIGPAGYGTATIAGASFPVGNFIAVSRCIDPLCDFTAARGQTLVQELLQELEARAPAATDHNTFAFLMIDGLSVREELVVRTLQGALGKIPLVGGSAGDGLHFVSTEVYSGGRFRRGSAVLVLVTTPLPFRPFFTQHFVASERRVVVTRADAAQRIVHELDGRPAAEAYAELIGCEVGALDPGRFATAPMAVMIGGVSYVRSISNATADGGLKFFCAIEEGVVMRVARGADLPGNLEGTFARLRAEIGPPQIILGCDCILRRLEIEQGGLLDRVGEVLRRNRVIGFNSYGEQYRGVHVNQTMTGIAIGGSGEGGGHE